MTSRGMIQRADAAGGFVLPSTVRAAKDRLNPYIEALATSVSGTSGGYTCALAPATAQGFAAWLQAWRNLYKAEEGFFTAAREMDEVEAYQADLPKWQAKIKQECPNAPTAPTPSTAGAPAAQTVAAAGSLAWAIVALAALYVLAPIARDFAGRRRR